MADQRFKTIRQAGKKVCPFCGHVDWCSQGTWDNGDVYWYCKRMREVNAPDKKGIFISPFDSQQYIYHGLSKNGSGVFQAKEQYDANALTYKTQGTFEPVDCKATTYTAEEVALRDKFYRYFLNQLTLEDYHFKKLSSEWGEMTPVWTKNYMIKSLPPVDKARFNNNMKLKNPTRKALSAKLTDKYPECGIAGFWKDEEYGVQFYRYPGIIYPVFNADNQIICLRIGIDYPAVVTEEGRYVWTPIYGEWKYIPDEDEEEAEIVYSRPKQIQKVKLNSNGLPDVKGKIDGKYKYVYAKNDNNPDGSYGSEVGLYLPSDMSKGYTVCFATEGEKKCIVGANTLKCPFILIPGVNSFRRAFEAEDGKEASIIETLKSRGCKIVVVAYDADKSHNKNVADNEYKFCTALKSVGIAPHIPVWEEQRGKGIDDLLMTGQQPIAYQAAIPYYEEKIGFME